MVIFQTERLRVRTLTEEDADNFYRLQGDPDVMRYIRPVKTREESDAALREVLALPEPETGGRWMIDEIATGRFAGTFAIIPVPYDPLKIQLGYAFVPECWGRGYATEVTRAGLAYIREHTTLTEIYAITETPNEASQKVLLKAGFHFLEKRMEDGKELQVFIVKR